MTHDDDPRRRIPQVDSLVRELEAEVPRVARVLAVEAAREAVEAARSAAAPTPDGVRSAAREALAARRMRLLVPVLNATGVVLHTNLGRAPLHPRALEAIAAVAGYSNLELDLSTGRRGRRDDHVEPLLALATGAQAALVVNNNAAAVLLCCTALAAGREVVVSRGELIEIGGEFRIPDVLQASGAILREVGTTNRTHLRDYRAAIGEQTALVLKVHPSNYRVVGFVAAPALDELAGLAHEHSLPLVYDLGSGLLGEGGAMSADEPEAREALAAGADLVCFSGDKLLGGPQAGIICGTRVLVDALRRHPLVRALRPGKLTLAALAATVLAHLEGARDELPVWRMAGAADAQLRPRCERLAESLAGAGFAARVGEGTSVVGGGSLPGVEIASPVVRVARAAGVSAFAARLREGDPAVVARIVEGELVLDLRTIEPRDDNVLCTAIVRAAAP